MLHAWWLIFVVNLTRFRITMETHLWVCLWEDLQESLVEKEDLPWLCGASFPGPESWNEWKGDSNHLSLFPGWWHKVTIDKQSYHRHAFPAVEPLNWEPKETLRCCLKTFIFFYVCLFLCVSACLQRPEGGTGSFEPGVRGIHKLPEMGAGIHIQSYPVLR